MKHFRFKHIIPLLLLALMFGISPRACGGESIYTSHDGYLVKLKEDAVIPFGVQDNLLSDESMIIKISTAEEISQFDPETVEYIEPDYMVELFSADTYGIELPDTPNDPYYESHQWNMKNINAYSAYRGGLRGRGVKVAFVDSGINAAHEDFQGLSIHGMNFLSEGEHTKDTYGHGSFSAGIAAAETNNGKGLMGIAPGMELYAYRVFGGKNTNVGVIVQALDQAVKDGCRVINMSLGTSAASKAMEDAVKRAVDSGAVVVAAVGNGGSGIVQYPAGFEGVIGVGSVDEDMSRSEFSQFNSSVDFTAPGGGVAGIGNMSADDYKLNMASKSNRGTSFSAPIVTGMAAIAIEYENTLTPDMIYKLLMLSSSDMGKAGRDDEYGNGVVNVERFVNELKRDYLVIYDALGGTVSENAPTTYSIKSEKPLIPDPEPREGYIFAGWHLSPDFKDKPVKTIPSDSVGDITLYAHWQDNRVIDVESVKIMGIEAKKAEGNSFNIVLPYGTDISSVTQNDFEITPVFVSGIVSDIKKDGSDFVFTVTDAESSISRNYRIYVEFSQLILKAEMENQRGSASPASLDGRIPPVPYVAENVSSWFEMADGSIMPDDFELQVTCTGKGQLKNENFRIEYIPSADDGGNTVTVEITGRSGGVPASSSALIDIAVSPLPDSPAVILTSSGFMDKAYDIDTVFSVLLYRKSVREIRIGDAPISEDGYWVSEADADNMNEIHILPSAAEMLPEDTYIVSITLDSGEELNAGLTVSDSRPPVSEAEKTEAYAAAEKIGMIGSVSRESESRMKEARKAYDALTASQKTYVKNADKLTEAEKQLSDIKGHRVNIKGKFRTENGKSVTAELYSMWSTRPPVKITLDSSKTEFIFKNIQEGEYKLVLSSEGSFDFVIENIEAHVYDIDFDTSENENLRVMNMGSGDVNLDGKINEIDVSVIRYPENINKDTFLASNKLADVNGDGRINEGDVSAVRNPHNINKSRSDFIFTAK